MATEYTPNYSFDLYASADKPNLRDQYNAAMGKIDTAIKGVANAETANGTLIANLTTRVQNDEANIDKNASDIAAANTAIGGKAPIMHAATGTTYGAGNETNYGHVKLLDATDSISNASAGTAATPAAVKSAMDTAKNASTAAGSATAAAQRAQSTADVASSTAGAAQSTANLANNKADANKTSLDALESEFNFAPVDTWYNGENGWPSMTQGYLQFTHSKGYEIIRISGLLNDITSPHWPEVSLPNGYTGHKTPWTIPNWQSDGQRWIQVVGVNMRVTVDGQFNPAYTASTIAIIIETNGDIYLRGFYETNSIVKNQMAFILNGQCIFLKDYEATEPIPPTPDTTLFTVDFNGMIDDAVNGKVNQIMAMSQNA